MDNMNNENVGAFQPLRFDKGHEPKEKNTIYEEKISWGDRYIVATDVGGYVYEYKLIPKDQKEHELLIRTQEYHYSIIDLSNKEKEELFISLRRFLLSVKAHRKQGLFVDIRPLDSDITKDDIERCKKEITDRDPSLQKSVDLYPNTDLFRMYSEIFGKRFESKHIREKTGAQLRTRYFRMNFKKYIPEAHISNENENGFVVRI